jgi:hypothetical protein
MSALLYSHVIPTSSNTVHESDDNTETIPTIEKITSRSDFPLVCDEEISIYGKTQKLITIENVDYVPPSDYEKSLLEGTMNTETLLAQEEEERKEVQENGSEGSMNEQLRDRHQYITMVKVIALVNCNKKPLDNPSTFNKACKHEIIQAMDEIMNTMNPDEIKLRFTEICNTKIFTSEVDYSTLPINCGR